MISKHCNEPLVTITWNPAYFRVKCFKCGKVFKQRKRRTNEHYLRSYGLIP